MCVCVSSHFRGGASSEAPGRRKQTTRAPPPPPPPLCYYLYRLFVWFLLCCAECSGKERKQRSCIGRRGYVMALSSLRGLRSSQLCAPDRPMVGVVAGSVVQGFPAGSGEGGGPVPAEAADQAGTAYARLHIHSQQARQARRPTNSRGSGPHQTSPHHLHPAQDHHSLGWTKKHQHHVFAEGHMLGCGR